MQNEVKRKTSPLILTVLILSLLIACLLLFGCQPAAGPNAGPAQQTRLAAKTQPAAATKTPRRSPTPTSTPVPTSALGVDAADLEGVAIEFWHPFLGETGEAVDAIIADFNNSNEWGIRVESSYQGNYDELFQRTSDAINHGDYPHLTVSYHYQAQAWEDIRSILVDLEAYTADPEWGYTQVEISDFYPVFWQHDLAGGRRLGIPALRSAQLIYYNTTWAEELGFDSPPETPSQFKEQACAAALAVDQDADPHNDLTGGWIIATDYPSILGWLDGFGASVVKPNDRGYNFNNGAVQEAFTFLRDLYDDGCAWLSDSQFPEDEFATRKGLFAIGTTSGIPSQEDAFADIDSSDEWTVLPFPSTEGENGVPVYGPSFQVLESSDEEQLASWLLIKWLTTPGNQARLAENSAMFPVRTSSIAELDRLTGTYPQWEKSAGYLENSQAEPANKSWRIVRWAVSDAATQLFRSYFTIDQVPSLIKLLDQTANMLHEEDS